MVAVGSSSVIGDVRVGLVGCCRLGAVVLVGAAALVLPAVVRCSHRSSRLLLFEILEWLERLCHRLSSSNIYIVSISTSRGAMQMFCLWSQLCLAPRGNMALLMVLLITCNIRYVFRHTSNVPCCTMLYNTMLYILYMLYMYICVSLWVNWGWGLKW